mmetsp:Transcript_12959/g.14877  ORF Transcript_12959/g.14877 Transcript_12959/m.14877 type:complete len:631 (+) Transcript_12959:409-2301(+)
MFKKIFLYVDRLYKLVKPRNVLYLAVDGVAPRAKMNQQRSRRFRSGKDAEKLAVDLLAAGKKLPQNRFDSNCITPGTDFMLKLSLALNKWVEYKQANDPFWINGATVIVSGPDVPGEGEHKVMDYVRECQAGDHGEQYRPGLQHVLYGLDADLIMLGLVTHEKEFMLLREKMSVVMASRRNGRKKKDMLDYGRNDFELLEINVLREMFQIQFRKFVDTKMDEGDSEYDIDRIVDDFVFMCMMVGNDFLPHSPHLEIESGALSLMMGTYMDMLPDWGGYLTDREKIHPRRFEEFMFSLSFYEQEHYKRRSYEEKEPGWALPTVPTEFRGALYENSERYQKNPDPTEEFANEEARRKALEKYYKYHPKAEEVEQLSYRDYYYQTKLRNNTPEFRRQHVRDYLEGLHWVLNYYHNGCQSWDWFFPHLYSPLASDMVDLDHFYDKPANDAESGYKSFPFNNGKPFPSLGQLLSVLPPQSANLLPPSFAELMLEPSSPIAEYYPTDFTSDPNGKRQSWEAVVDVPFIDSDVLLEVVNQVLDDTSEERMLSNSERRRNKPGDITVYEPKRDFEGPIPGFVEAKGSGSGAPRARRKVTSNSGVRGGRGGNATRVQSGGGRGRGGRGGRGSGRSNAAQ